MILTVETITVDVTDNGLSLTNRPWSRSVQLDKESNIWAAKVSYLTQVPSNKLFKLLFVLLKVIIMTVSILCINENLQCNMIFLYILLSMFAVKRHSKLVTFNLMHFKYSV